MSDPLTSLKAKLFAPEAIFSIAEAKRYIEEVQSFAAIDTREPFHKRFFHEFWPLVTIAETVGSPDMRIIFTGSGAGADGCLEFGSNGPRQMVELTVAFDGYQEALRMEHLDLYGDAPATGRIVATGSRNRRQIERSQIECEPTGQFDRELAERMKDALQAKRDKARARPHYQNAWLGIVIQDYPPTAYKKRRFDPLCIDLVSDQRGFAPFARVFVVSAVGDYIFDSQTALFHSSL